MKNACQPLIETTHTSKCRSKTPSYRNVCAESQIPCGFLSILTAFTALVNKIISNASPASCSATKDFKSALNVAGVVFIHYITALCVLLQLVAPSVHLLRVCCRAATKASDSGKATLSLDHVLDALKDAGFEDMVSAVALQVNGTNFIAAAILFTAIMHVRVLWHSPFHATLSAFKDQQSEKKRGAAEASTGGSKKQKSESCILE